MTLICFILVLAACRAHHFSLHHKTPVVALTSSSNWEERLTELHFYELIAQKHSIAGHTKKALTARSEAEKIAESVLKDAQTNSAQLKNLILAFSQKSPLHAHSLKALAGKLKLPLKTTKITKADLEKEIAHLKITREFQVFETNVEYLSYMLESNARL